MIWLVALGPASNVSKIATLRHICLVGTGFDSRATEALGFNPFGSKAIAIGQAVQVLSTENGMHKCKKVCEAFRLPSMLFGPMQPLWHVFGEEVEFKPEAAAIELVRAKAITSHLDLRWLGKKFAAIDLLKALKARGSLLMLRTYGSTARFTSTAQSEREQERERERHLLYTDVLHLTSQFCESDTEATKKCPPPAMRSLISKAVSARLEHYFGVLRDTAANELRLQRSPSGIVTDWEEQFIKDTARISETEINLAKVSSATVWTEFYRLLIEVLLCSDWNHQPIDVPLSHVVPAPLELERHVCPWEPPRRSAAPTSFERLWQKNRLEAAVSLLETAKRQQRAAVLATYEDERIDTQLEVDTPDGIFQSSQDH